MGKKSMGKNMSWFYYGEPSHRSWRKGVALRVQNLSPEIFEHAEKLMDPCEEIDYVLVEELREPPYVLLAVHVRKPGSFASELGNREGVIRFKWKEDRQWVCEGDLGRGCVEARRKS
jgi:hypothetical protein